MKILKNKKIFIMFPLTLRNKSVNLYILFNVTSLFFILSNVVLCNNLDGGADNINIRRAINNTSNDTVVTHADKTKEEKEESSVDSTIVWVCVAIMYLLFGFILYLVIKSIIERRRKKIARRNAINELEMGDNLKMDMYKEIIKLPPPVTKK
ncbi:hypothetical protein C1645_762441 [Glomus cerebriforme]|uniref:Uncharacterized protein n=1 Tax=Glomus cerebriforme TaxID=658196 RepID=A0A397T936_9GLOM|nr:hypothetical protein C1645_762441 [Glomus cerebriforme]